MSPREVDCTATLANGVVIRIRSLRADDRERIAKAFRLLDRESVYRRFFAFKTELTAADLDRITAPDPAREVALVATVGVGADETIIASSRYVATAAPAPQRTAEVAFMVEEDYQGLGIASRLLRHLVNIARADGIGAFEADVLAGNEAMLAVLSRAGLPMTRRHEQGVVHVVLSLQPDRHSRG